ncbi:uncharacterized protein BYT42DRAFT_578779 [Radiomyces spectabilis]|uniref:uncharacterized protein n=1 Tax=Radiomyces spectabilis TaxID=64574 RepID=UPI00221FAB8E|nr:uncharacterized protein BYT42DRAFT_578779 [Radiomyces spectabilis]KAI8372983.1 hypothetical protein BYT42DRAFT_578779 [Radiomyces spectabilis]
MREQQSKSTQQRHERILNELARIPGNDQCADCKTKNPRWASYSLGIFLCIRCASLHRKMGTHISKVKSISMDRWSADQIETMRQSGGNATVNSLINPHPERHPLPLALDDDFAMERYIRSKWEKRSFADHPETLKTEPTRSASAPLVGHATAPAKARSSPLSHSHTMPVVPNVVLQQDVVSMPPTTAHAFPPEKMETTFAGRSSPLTNNSFLPTYAQTPSIPSTTTNPFLASSMPPSRSINPFTATYTASPGPMHASLDEYFGQSSPVLLSSTPSTNPFKSSSSLGSSFTENSVSFSGLDPNMTMNSPFANPSIMTNHHYPSATYQPSSPMNTFNMSQTNPWNANRDKLFQRQ